MASSSTGVKYRATLEHLAAAYKLRENREIVKTAREFIHTSEENAKEEGRKPSVYSPSTPKEALVAGDEVFRSARKAVRGGEYNNIRDYITIAMKLYGIAAKNKGTLDAAAKRADRLTNYILSNSMVRKEVLKSVYEEASEILRKGSAREKKKSWFKF